MSDENRRNEESPRNHQAGDSAAQNLPPQGSSSAPAAEEDASRGEVALYAFGNIEGALANQFYAIMNAILIMSMGINPLITGLIIGIKTLWDGLTDPIMAYFSDSARTRWGRRRPFILVGGVGRIVFLAAVFVFFPRDIDIESNAVLKAKESTQDTVAVATVAEPATDSVSTAAAADSAMVLAHVPAAGQDVEDSSIVAASADAQEGQEETKPLVLSQKRKSLWQNIKAGWRAFNSPEEAGHRKIIIYVFFAFIGFTTLTTIQSVPYYALGIELSPSYNGRTRVVAYRSIMDKVAGLAGPWVLPFCYLAIFRNVLDGLVWYSMITVVIGIPSTILMVMYTKERTHVTPSRKTKDNIFRSMWVTVKNVHFLKILMLYLIFAFGIQTFSQIGLFLNVYWIFGGDKLAGTAMAAKVQMVAWVLGLVALPFIKMVCDKFQKHNALRFAILMMVAGSLLNWVCLNPEHPEYQYLLPLFYSIGITSLFTVLGTLMADVTDIDELNTGARREGMFGAVMAFLMKTFGSVTPIIAGILLVTSGFKASNGMHQPDEVILKMRLIATFGPAATSALGLLILYRYPLTRKRMEDVKAMLRTRRAAAEA